MIKFLLLSPLDMSDIKTAEDLTEALEEFGCTFEESNGDYYAVSSDLAALTQMAFNVELPGHIVEYTGFYKSTETETTTEQE
jgi:hypothetical protein